MNDGTQNTENELYEIDELRILDCGKLSISVDKSGFLSVSYEGKEYSRVDPSRLIPFFSPTTYISLTYENEDRELFEIGVIRDMKDLSDEQYKLLDKFLNYKYYMPRITKVYNIRDNMRGSIFVKADTTAGEKTICVRDWYQNFRMLNEEYLYVTDADGNKYFCPKISELDKKSRNVLEMFT
ncbi:MAG: DUF1854 domain-containing protein [Ruminococcus sp.]|nr:DUF1854 domain-containing protein [Ruminococcus sp.]